MDELEKANLRELEKALQEIERLRQENSRLRKMLGMEVSEDKADYNQSGPISAPTKTRIEETQESRRSEKDGLPIFSARRFPHIASNLSTKEKIKLFRTLFRGREDIYAVFG